MNNLDSLSLFAVLLSRKNPYLSFHVVGQIEPIVASYLAVQDRIVLIRGLQMSFARLSALAERAIYHLTNNTRAAMLPRPASLRSENVSLALLMFIARCFIDKIIWRSINRFRYREHWSIATLWSDHWEIPNLVPPQGFVELPEDGKRCYADPFLFSQGGQKWLFVEELEYRRGKGIISVTEVVKGKTIAPPRPALVRPYHLSYPFVFEYRDEIYMMPENGKSGRLELYRARSFPFDWELSDVLIENIELFDATLLHYRDKWWIFAAIAHKEGSAQDELAIFHSAHLEGPWQPHRLNPVKSDCRSARPAGHFIVSGNRLLRPAQDCEETYGSALVWLEIEELTTEQFREREVGRWPGNALLNGEGIHTFNCIEELGVVDIRRAVWRRPFVVKGTR